MPAGLPRWLSADDRLTEYAMLPIGDALDRIFSIWANARALHCGPGPFGTTVIPLESQLADWLAYAHPETEARIAAQLVRRQPMLAAYCIHTLLRMGSKLLASIPDWISQSSAPITRCHGCSMVTVPLSQLFTGELSTNALCFEGDLAGRPSGWWLREDDLAT